LEPYPAAPDPMLTAPGRLCAVDPYEVLGVPPGASAEEVAAAYREAAKRWHPDRAGAVDAAAAAAAASRMAEVNAAYDQLRGGTAPPPAPPEPARSSPSSARVRDGSWLSDELRRRLGPELTAALHDREHVAIVTPAATWASPQTLLAVTDRRLLWLLDDAVTGRVRSLPFHAIASVEHALRWPRRRDAVVRVRNRAGRRFTFSHLRPEVARAIAERVQRSAAA
jgi:DnaJ domain